MLLTVARHLRATHADGPRRLVAHSRREADHVCYSDPHSACFEQLRFKSVAQWRTLNVARQPSAISALQMRVGSWAETVDLLIPVRRLEA